ncbi:hypothetical protein D9758_015934 [Tetrapyrgos nigripes]|uniref:Aquaporin n=1 Tax=Tetrapyrgos nigripes TaxID=182062 RepID=A0A8H5FHI3_9AGAR|nr:hypothetical protein D9758_015934 [Tetrapyrgos nigripes]
MSDEITTIPFITSQETYSNLPFDTPLPLSRATTIIPGLANQETYSNLPFDTPLLPSRTPTIMPGLPSYDSAERMERGLTAPVIIPALEALAPKSRIYNTRQWLREPAAEFSGMMILIIFGAGVNCQVSLSNHKSVSASRQGDNTTIAMGWAAGLSLGVWISAGISGGHLNPAITLALATFRGFPWRKVPGTIIHHDTTCTFNEYSHPTVFHVTAYIFAQVLGGIAGAATVYMIYFNAINLVEGGHGARTLTTAGVFSTFAAHYVTDVSAFFSEFIATTILIVVILAVTDKRNTAPPLGLVPVVLFIVVVGLATAIGMNTGSAVNPARDLGPRIFMAMAGYGSEIWTFRNHYWLWCPIVAPILGAMVGTIFYDTLLYTEQDSYIVRYWEAPWSIGGKLPFKK